MKHLRGEPGTDVTITMLRPSTGQVKDYKLTRAVINVDMVKDINSKKEFPLGEDKIGYVRLVQFGEKTSDDLEKALHKLKAQGMQGLILDLRWNPGGLLDQAVDVCEIPAARAIGGFDRGPKSVTEFCASGGWAR